MIFQIVLRFSLRTERCKNFYKSTWTGLKIREIQLGKKPAFIHYWARKIPCSYMTVEGVEVGVRDPGSALRGKVSELCAL